LACSSDAIIDAPAPAVSVWKKIGKPPKFPLIPDAGACKISLLTLDGIDMVALTTPVCDFGWIAPDFSLPGVDGHLHSLASASGHKGVLVMFLCNHCPYVQAILPRLVEDCRQMRTLGLGAIAIMSNDTDAYPEDALPQMLALATRLDFSFPYVLDATQEVARAYGAVCTPDFFGFNTRCELQYRGRFDASGTQALPTARRELLAAMTQIAQTGQGPKEQMASIGCSLKWRA
jgi:peroxiredoxin